MHPYFNLGGAHDRPIDDHLLMVEADDVLELDAALIPTGARLAVARTLLDFRSEAAIGERLGTTHPQLHLARWPRPCLRARPRSGSDARLRHPGTGLAMSVVRNQPTLQGLFQHLAPPTPDAAPGVRAVVLPGAAGLNAVNERTSSSLRRGARATSTPPSATSSASGSELAFPRRHRRRRTRTATRRQFTTGFWPRQPTGPGCARPLVRKRHRGLVLPPRVSAGLDSRPMTTRVRSFGGPRTSACGTTGAA